MLFENYVLKWKGVTSVMRDFYGADEIQKQKKHMSLFCKLVAPTIIGSLEDAIWQCILKIWDEDLFSFINAILQWCLL